VGPKAVAGRAVFGRTLEGYVKGNRMYVDIGTILDEVFDAAKSFGANFQDMGDKLGEKMGPNFNVHVNTGPGVGAKPWFDMGQDENADYYPGYSYPPMNIYLTSERGMVFEFALAGFDEKDIFLNFQGDYMVFNAKIGLDELPENDVRYFKRRLKLKDVEKQKYYVPADKFSQDRVRAVFRNGILKVTVPPKEESDAPEGIKIEILKEGE
jgi:HSP20 family molecular chaperone IbpA